MIDAHTRQQLVETALSSHVSLVDDQSSDVIMSVQSVADVPPSA